MAAAGDKVGADPQDSGPSPSRAQARQARNGPNDGNPSLRRWRVIEVVSKSGTRSRHVYGHDAANSTGRASSAIKEFNRETMTVTTRSGRTYQLVGAPGKARIGEHAWQSWCDKAGVVSEMDVTSEYFSIDSLFNKAAP
jgi:hypothetical protein